MAKLSIGDQVPYFEVIDHSTSGGGKRITSDAFRGQKWVLYFYPRDLTPTCILQACNIRDHFLEFKNKDIKVLGISMDGDRSHQRFIQKYKLPFPLLSDEDRKIIDAFGVWGEKKFMGRTFDGIHRTTFVMDEENTIIGIIEKPKSKQHTNEILAIYQSVLEERK